MFKVLRLNTRLYSTDPKKSVADLLKLHQAGSSPSSNKKSHLASTANLKSNKFVNQNQKQGHKANNKKNATNQTKNNKHPVSKATKFEVPVQGIFIPGTQPTPQPFKQEPTLMEILTLQIKNYDPESFKFKYSLNQNENEYLTEKIKAIYETNPKFQIVYKTETEVKQAHFLRFFSKLKDDESFDILTIKKDENGSGNSYPFLTVINKKAALKTYQEKKAEELTKKYGRTVEKKRSLNLKYIKVSWSINQYDLESQKTNEILAHLKKSNKLVVLIDTKEGLERLNLNNLKNFEQDKSEAKLNDLEKIKREKILTYLLELFKTKAALDSTEKEVSDFKLTQKIMINVSPLQTQIEVKKSEKKKPDDNGDKSNKKLSRQEKQKLREEQKRLLMEQKRKEFEETMRNL